MRIDSSVTAISWIPSEAIEGMPKLPFELGIGKYDEPPPDRLEEGDLERLRDEDRFREANHLGAWVEVEDGKIVGHGHAGYGLVGSTRFSFGGPMGITVPGVAFDVLQPEPEVSGEAVRFVQTVGGRAGFPAPRRVSGKPYFRIHSATAWTTLALTIRADGSSEYDVVGASPFPRHWIYDGDGNLAAKSGTVDFKTWYREAHGDNTPWGDEESDAYVTATESALEREISRELLTNDLDLKRRKLKPDESLVEQGAAGRGSLSAPRRRARGGGGRRGGRGDRAGGDSGRACLSRGRQAHRDLDGADALPDRGHPGGPDRQAGDGGHRRRPSRAVGRLSRACCRSRSRPGLTRGSWKRTINRTANRTV